MATSPYLKWMAFAAICTICGALPLLHRSPEILPRAPQPQKRPDPSAALAPTATRIGEPIAGRAQRIAQAAYDQIGRTTLYDPSYVALSYPGGDVPSERGVCCDVVVRALRSIGLDLQKTVHEDMAVHFSHYPNHWGLRRPDSNIDHRRVPNLMTWFSRHGWDVPRVPTSPLYESGDIIAWDLGNGRTHIGIVVVSSGAPNIVHNIGAGTVKEPVLDRWKKIGHFRLPVTSD